MKKKVLLLISVLSLLLTCGCGNNTGKTNKEYLKDATKIVLSDSEITVDGDNISTDSSANVYKANDIVYYEADKGFTYGQGSKEDEHTKEEADKHVVVHITKPGTYALSGSLSAGQVAIDLGNGAKENPEAVVNLLLNNVDIKCSVAPSIIFYNVYECGTTTGEATKDINTSDAGANVIILDDTVNNIEGSYVARIYKSYELNEEGTEVIANKKLHKYDGAFYSKMSMNVDGSNKGNGILNIKAENEGLDSELHLTINGGNINITSGNDGINTNEDGVSVTTINGGVLNIVVDGLTGEGDGIDSNGWVVINGGTVVASACEFSMDSGIDSDMGIYINGGTVIASGNMLDRISESNQNYAVFNFSKSQKGGTAYLLKDSKNKVVLECMPENGFTNLIVSSGKLKEGSYTLWEGDKKLSGAKGEGMERPGMPPEGMERPGMPPEGMERPEMPSEGMERPEMPSEGMERPEKMEPIENFKGKHGKNNDFNVETSTEFKVTNGGNYYSNITTEN